MDPVSVLRTLWRHRLLAGVVLVLTVAAMAYVLVLSPRTYASTATYALVNPKLPTTAELEADPAVAALNSDNPYLRSSDNSLAAQVLVTVLNSDETAEALAAQGLSTQFAVERSAWSGQGLLLSVTADAPTADGSLATTTALGDRLVDTLRGIQTVNGADDRYLFTALEVQTPGKAVEQISDRLRAVIMVAVGGIVLLFGAISIARAVEGRRSARPGPSSGPSHAARPALDAAIAAPVAPAAPALVRPRTPVPERSGLAGTRR
ncbi:chain-length determining protein [Rathayibacter sp. VKM Ac-2856]|uniref:chain-length determining protein n=1 Tax=unclassified Rathayibacter TaxID=2609250 RepID=UPI001567A1B5|nr:MULTISPECIES: chain-length determining protein [unclassified Rathayibacter]NQX06697.1 chain-length determining protein [Rathayibacter sp. VKM Ac-2858]NQX21864.1 chain-length determining protein [Rathayibacter sp. VKM Ac-2856]